MTTAAELASLAKLPPEFIDTARKTAALSERILAQVPDLERSMRPLVELARSLEEQSLRLQRQYEEITRCRS